MVAGDTEDSALPHGRAALAAWLFGVLLLAAVVGVVLHLGELGELGWLLRGLRLIWLVDGAVLQSLTYVCAAAV